MPAVTEIPTNTDATLTAAPSGSLTIGGGGGGGGGGFAWNDLADQGAPTVVRDVRGHLDAGTPPTVAGTTITVPLDATIAGASWNDSAVLSFGLPPELNDGAGNFKAGTLVFRLTELDGNLDATQYQVQVGLATAGISGGIHHNTDGTIQTGSTVTGAAGVGAGTGAAADGRTSLTAMSVGGSNISLTTNIVQGDNAPSTAQVQNTTGTGVGTDAIALVIGFWGGSGSVTLNCRVQWMFIPDVDP